MEHLFSKIFQNHCLLKTSGKSVHLRVSYGRITYSASNLRWQFHFIVHYGLYAFSEYDEYVDVQPKQNDLKNTLESQLHAGFG